MNESTLRLLAIARTLSFAPRRARVALALQPAPWLFGAVLCAAYACSDGGKEGSGLFPAMTAAGAGGASGAATGSPAGAGAQTPSTPASAETDGPAPKPPAGVPTPRPMPSAPQPQPSAPEEDLAAQCEACLNLNCQAQWDACENDAECVALIECVAGCAPNDPSCGPACDEQHPAGRDVLEAFIRCGDTRCPACTASEGSPSDPNNPDGCSAPNPSPWPGPAVWTQAEVQACLDKCEDDQCVAEQCQDGEEFLECVAVAGTQCAGAPTGPCRAEFEAFWCCIDACEAASADMASIEACLDRDCPMQREAWFQCGADDTVCATALRSVCIVAGR